MSDLRERLKKSFLEYDVVYFSISIEEARVLNRVIKLRYDNTEESGFHAAKINGMEGSAWEAAIKEISGGSRIAVSVLVFYISQGGTRKLYTKYDFDPHDKNRINYMICKKSEKNKLVESFDAPPIDKFIELKINQDGW
jgi:hypothetical protein